MAKCNEKKNKIGSNDWNEISKIVCEERIQRNVEIEFFTHLFITWNKEEFYEEKKNIFIG